MKGFGKFLTILIFFIVVGAFGGFFYVKNYYETTLDTPNAGSSEQVIVEIHLGSTIRDIGEQLKKEGLIADERVFEYYVRTNNLSDKFLAGKYETKGNKTLLEVIEDLQVPIKDEVTITIPEGIRFTQIADRLDKVMKISPNWSKEEFLELAENPGNNFAQFTILSTKPADKSLEGFLFPDTYIFGIEYSTKDVMNRMLQNTEDRISGKLLDDIIASEFTVYEVLNFASIIERETIQTEDRYLVGDILYRRYKAGWALGVDATILYEHGDWKYEIRQKDLESKTPYNTRLIKGLPPTPICNPGLETINGFIYRKENDNWYYISDSEGNMYYAKTLTEHNKNIQKYLK